MPQVAPLGATIAEVTHHVAEVNGASLHYVTAGESGTPVLLVHGRAGGRFARSSPISRQTIG